ncbi:MAG: GntP family permease [Lachnospiraceae bacterium]|nr:GntP family permease [Lachnospiraceae bacterium]
MLSGIGLIIAIALMIFMIAKGIDMITTATVTAAIILVTSGLNFWEGMLGAFSEGAGGFVTSWFLILGLGGIFGELVNQTGLATKIAKSLSQALGAKRVGLIMLICTFFITLLGINGYIMVFVLYPIADNLLRENKMDRRLLPFLMICGGANANSFAFSMDICNVIPSNFLGTSLGVAPGLSVVFSAITCTCYVLYFNFAQKKSRQKHSEAELLAMYVDNNVVMKDEELPNLVLSLLPFVVVLATVMATTSLGTSTSLASALLVGVVIIIVTQFKKIKNLKASVKNGASSGLSTMLTVAAVIGLSKILTQAPAFAAVQSWVLNMTLPIYLKTWVGTMICGALTGSAITAETLFLESFGQAFLDAGANINALHRIVAEAGITLNKLPNASPVIMETSVCKCTLAESYKHVVIGSVIPCIIAGFIITMMATMGIIF